MSFCQSRASSFSVSRRVLSRTSAEAGRPGGWCSPRELGRPPLVPPRPRIPEGHGSLGHPQNLLLHVQDFAPSAHAAAQEGERRRFDALAQARKPAAKRACLVAYATANPIHLLATRSYHRPATSITAVREAITPSSTPALSRQGIASPRPAPKLLMRIVWALVG